MSEWAGKTPTKDQWRDILEKHARWTRGEAEGQRANLGGANLGGANLRSANLRSANLGGANLGGADLGGANLRGANLGGADLRSANLGGADLRSANLRSANLGGADLGGADLRGANLGGANLKDAKGGELAIARTRILPDGYLLGWKKCRQDVLVLLAIPPEAKRSHAFGRKCRAEYAEVKGIEAPDGTRPAEARSLYDNAFVYRVGETVKPIQKFDEDWMNECGSGIHFYLSRVEASAHE